MADYETIDKFDRALGGLEGVPGVDKTKPTTSVATIAVVGRASTFIVQTYRQRFEDNPTEIEKAKQFYRSCAERLHDHGFFPYRSGSGLFGSLADREPAFEALLQGLKTAIDPKRVLSPGKYRV